MTLSLFSSMLELVLIGFTAWIAIRLSINFWRIRKGRFFSASRELLVALCVLYLLFVAAATVAPLPASATRRRGYTRINLVPAVRSVRCLVRNLNGYRPETRFCLRNIAGNIAMFIPLGIFLPLLSSHFRTPARVILAGAVISSVIELTQYVSGWFGIYRYVDVDDVILNTTGIAIGFLGYACLRRTGIAGTAVS